MSYERMYPQNIAPKGTKVQLGFENDDKEIKRIYDILSNSGAFTLTGSKRQSVLYGSTDSSGNPNFLTANQLYVSIDGSKKPVILAFATGFSPSAGTVDLLDKIDSIVSNAWTLPANTTCYLFIDKDAATGLLSYGYTTLPDQYLKSAPTNPVLNQHYFNTIEMKMYCFNGATWDEKQRIFVAKAVTTSTTALSIYDFGSRFFSKVSSPIDSTGAIRCGNSVEINSSNGTLTLTDDSNIFVVDKSVIQNNTQAITSMNGALALTGTGPSFSAYGTENIASITGLTSGSVVIQWVNDRTLVNSANLSLLGSINRAVKSGSFSIFSMSASGATETGYYSQENITAITGWNSGIVAIEFNTIRTLVNSSNLILQDGINRITQIGDVGLYSMENGIAHEISYFTATRPKTGLPGTGNYIASGRKMSLNSLNVTLSAGDCYINGKTISFAQNTLLLPPRKALLLYDKSDGTTGYVAAKAPIDFIDDNTVGMWLFNQPAGTAIPNSAVGKSKLAVANDLKPSGKTTQVDGIFDYALQGDGSSGYLTAANMTNFPAGANIIEAGICFTYYDTTAVYLIAYGTAANIQFLSINVYSTGQVVIDLNVATYATGFYLTFGYTYDIHVQYTGTQLILFVNGVQVYSVTATLNLVAGSFTILKRSDQAYYSKSVVHYAEIRKALSSNKRLGSIANSLILPCSYNDDANARRNIIDDLIPSGAVSLGYVLTNSSKDVEHNDTDYKYGRREKAFGGNRRVFLGWKYFSGATILSWDNPFGTRKVKTYYTFSTDAKGTNECDAQSAFYTSAYFGVAPYVNIGASQTASNRISTGVASGGIWFNNSFYTTGYIGCYAEVMEDYKGVDG